MFAYQNRPGNHVPGPYVSIRVTDNYYGKTFPAFEALVDSGADYSGISKALAAKLPVHGYDSLLAEGFDGVTKKVDVIRVLDALIEFLDGQGNVLHRSHCYNVRFVVLPDGLVGRDILNHEVCVLDGPALKLQFS